MRVREQTHGLVAGFGEDLGKRDVSVVEKGNPGELLLTDAPHSRHGLVAPVFDQQGKPSPRVNRCRRDEGRRGLCEGPVEHQPLSSELVDERRRGAIVPVESDVVAAKRIDEHEKHVRPAVRRGCFHAAVAAAREACRDHQRDQPHAWPPSPLRAPAIHTLVVYPGQSPWFQYPGLRSSANRPRPPALRLPGRLRPGSLSERPSCTSNDSVKSPCFTCVAPPAGPVRP